MNRICILIIFYSLIYSFSWGQSSVLAEGSWIKIGVLQDGIYKIDATLLTKSGWNVNTINPQTIRLYGNGGAPLPQSNAAVRIQDLQENAITVTGSDDGSFDASDLILFYGKSPHEIKLDTTAGTFSHQVNPYCDTTYYFLTYGNGTGKRISSSETTISNSTITTYEDYIFHESDEVNKVSSGREWYGEPFYVTTERTISLAIPGIQVSKPLLFTSATLAYASVNTTFTIKLNDQLIGTQTVGATTYSTYDYKGINAYNQYQTTLAVAPTDGAMKITLTYDRNGDNAAEGQLNYLGLQATRSLAWQGNTFRFRSLASQALSSATLNISNIPSGLQVWDVSDPPVIRQESLNSDGTFSFIPNGKVHEFIAFTSSTILSPAYSKAIANQDLHAASTPNLLIITPPAFRTDALRLATFRQQHDHLSVLVATTQEVYNEFSSGQPDPTAIRDFTKYLYDKQPGTLAYLLLLGDATYDYRNIMKGNINDCYVPVYESRESLHPIYSYSSDDYFGFLKTNEGEWPEDDSGDYTLSIGIGRLPVKSATEASEMVDKLIHYADSSTKGNWQSKITFVADDGDSGIHMQDAESLNSTLKTEQPAFLAEKLYLDTYPQPSQASPLANKALNLAMKDGRLILTFAGHGGVSGWTQEQILQLSDILGWRNYDNMPLLLTATCAFGRYDDPGTVSGAELALLNTRGGSIGLLTTTRPVFSSTNLLLSLAFMKYVFEPINGQMPRLGDVFRKTKNASLAGRVNRNFTLLGDPSMQLNYPQDTLLLTASDTLKAGEQITITGISSTSFDGTAWLEVYDQDSTYQTLGDENTAFSYQDHKSLLYKGTVTVQSGTFSSSFVVPISIHSGSGKAFIRAYALSSDASYDALGTLSPQVGGKTSTPVADNQSPTVQVYLNNEGFHSGDATNSNPTLLVSLSDDNGISLTEQQPITATLNDTLIINLNTYYQTDNGHNGTISYDLQALPSGPHTLTLQAFDVFGKSVSETIQFSVSPNTKNLLENVKAMPNPFQSWVRFSFDHEFEGEDTDINIYLYDLSGHLCHQQAIQSYATPSPYEDIIFEHVDIAPGMYIYRIFVRSTTQNRTLTGSGKLIRIP
ncbi:MAG: type IX secretion system sortase PorU [Siphonobacter sp.]